MEIGTKMKRSKMILMMAALLTGSFITTLAETLMNNGLPIIMEETHVTQISAQWLNTGYMLVAGMIMPLANFFLHRFPLKKLFTVTMTVFLLGTVISALAPNFTVLLLGRLIQASAVGVNMPLVTNVLTIIAPLHKRVLALGIAGIIINLGPAVGPTLSGIILEFYSWQMLFIILIPIVVFTIIATQFWVEDVIKPTQITADIQSVGLAVSGLGLLLYSLGRCGEKGSSILVTLLLACLGSCFIVIFVKRQFKIANPLLDLHVFKSRRYCLGLTITLLVSAAIMAPELILPLFNQTILKVTPILSGMVMIPSAVTMALLFPIAGRLYDEYGIKRLAMLGVVIGLITVIPMAFYNTNTSLILITVLYALRCGGLTLSYTPAEVYALNALPKSQVTSGNIIIVTMVQVANSFGTALAVSVQSIVQHMSQHANLAAVRGYQWAFGSTVLVTLIACFLVAKIKETSTKTC